jgi:hypothetical protein
MGARSADTWMPGYEEARCAWTSSHHITRFGARTDWRLAADYYFFRHAGVGVQYKYNKYSYDRGVLVTKLGGQVTFQGGQVFLSFLF